MTIALILVAIVAVSAPIGVVAFVIGRKGLCPGCNQRGLEVTDALRGTEGTEDGGRRPYTFTSYRCRHCDAEWCNYNQRGLITKQAYARRAPRSRLRPCATTKGPRPRRRQRELATARRAIALFDGTFVGHDQDREAVPMTFEVLGILGAIEIAVIATVVLFDRRAQRPRLPFAIARRPR